MIAARPSRPQPISWVRSGPWDAEADAAVAARLPKWSAVKTLVSQRVSKGLAPTLLALVALKAGYPSDEPLWRRAATKAIALLAGQAKVDVGTVRAWIDEAVQALRDA